MQSCKVVILAGGRGTRFQEETELKPKPMIEIGGKPILWHIMKIYSHYGFNDFIICLGYKGYLIKEYFQNYALHSSDITVDLTTGQTQIHQRRTEPWKVTLVDTGEDSMTGGRLLRVKPYLEGEKHFMLTYGDGVGNVDISALLKDHAEHKRAATVTAVLPPGRFGSLNIDDQNQVFDFTEKPMGDGGRISGGFFVFNQAIFNFLENDATVLEQQPLKSLAARSQLKAYKHDGFWQPMDTLRDKIFLENLWSSGKAPWKTW